MNRQLRASRPCQPSGALLLVAGLLAVAGLRPAGAEIGTIDTVPAATLLLPYFEVDLTDPQGVNTLFSISNAGDGPAIVNVTLWTDWSVPTLTFNAYLTGFDIMDVDLRNLFVAGLLPATSHNNSAVSPVGAFSEVTNPNTGVGPATVSCNALLPLPSLPSLLISHIGNSHTGQSSAIFGGACSGSARGDSVARGYITVDNVNICTLDFPGDPGYFIDGGVGVASNVNALLGSYRIWEEANGVAHGGAAVHIEASSTDPRTAPGRYTFYARYSGGTDNREPLASALAAPYVSGVTDLIYWRDSKLTHSPVSCGSIPLPFPMTHNQVVLFDQEENPEIPETDPFSPPIGCCAITPLAFEAGRVRVGSADFPTFYDRGWLYLNLGTSTGSPLDPLAQGWMAVADRDPSGLLITGQPAWQIFNTSEGQEIILPCSSDFPPPLCGTSEEIFSDGFESGGLGGWSVTVP